MTENKQIYKCDICGNIVEILHVGTGTPICCSKQMTLQKEHNEDSGLEKHVPIVEKEGQTVTVKVGNTTHPMEESHFIEWIEVIVDGETLRKCLTHTDKPQASFLITKPSLEVRARAYCNIHGLWKS